MPSDQQYLDEALDTVCRALGVDEAETDSLCKVSRNDVTQGADAGAWAQVWVWVPSYAFDNKEEPRCADCGEAGEATGHMGCQYPQDHNEEG